MAAILPPTNWSNTDDDNDNIMDMTGPIIVNNLALTYHAEEQTKR